MGEVLTKVSEGNVIKIKIFCSFTPQQISRTSILKINEEARWNSKNTLSDEFLFSIMTIISATKPSFCLTWMTRT